MSTSNTPPGDVSRLYTANDDLSSQKKTQELERTTRKEKVNGLLDGLKSNPAGGGKESGNPKNKQYSDIMEDICFKIISITFVNDLEICIPKRHPRIPYIYGFQNSSTMISGNPEDVPDIHLPVGVANRVWEDLLSTDDGHKSRDIIFECKNYNSNLTSKEVYQVFEYLVATDSYLGFIICRVKRKQDNSFRKAIATISKIKYVVKVLDFDDIERWIETFISIGKVERFFFDLIKSKNIPTLIDAQVAPIKYKV